METMTAFEMAEGFTKPLDNNPRGNAVPDDVLKAQDALQARRKLILILKSKAVKKLPVKVSDYVEVCTKKEHHERGVWSTPKPILSIHPDSKSVAVPGRESKTRTVAIEDIRPAIADSSLAKTVQEGIDELDNYVIDITGTNTAKSSSEDASNELYEITPDMDFTNEDSNVPPAVGDHLPVYWPLDDTYYGCKGSAFT